VSYQPNLADPRVLRRIRHALGFTLGVLSATKPHQWSTRYIDKHFGISSNPLSKYLRSLLLVTTNSKWSKDTGMCKEYICNTQGVSYLRSVLKGTTTQSYEDYLSNTNEENPISSIPYCITSFCNDELYDYNLVRDWVVREYGAELNTEFRYEDKSSRLWHPIQNIRSRYRRDIMSEQGYRYNYDISCCAPTLILRHAQELGLDEWMPAIQEYIANKERVRSELAAEVDVDISKIKVLINSLFCGARLGCNNQFALSELFGHDRAVIMCLQEHPYLTQLRNDIRECWRTIEPTLVRRVDIATGRKIPLSSKQKWGRYFELERIVQTSIRKYLTANHNQYFLEHDGWCCKAEVAVDELSEWVYRDTGYWIRIE